MSLVSGPEPQEYRHAHTRHQRGREEPADERQRDEGQYHDEADHQKEAAGITAEIQASHGYPFAIFSAWPLSETVPSSPPRPIVSTADEGTITMAPFSLIAS